MEMLKVFTQGIFGPTYYMQSEGFSDRLKTALRGNKSGLPSSQPLLFFTLSIFKIMQCLSITCLPSSPTIRAFSDHKHCCTQWASK